MTTTFEKQVIGAAYQHARATAVRVATSKAIAFFKADYESCEVWEFEPWQVTVRAWDTAGDYDFFSAEVSRG